MSEIWKCGKCGGTPYEHSLNTSTCVWEPVLIATEQPKAAMKPPVIHVVTPESSSGKLWEEVQQLQAVEAESARTIAHLNQTHREVSEMQQARIEELEKALTYIAKFAESMRNLGTAGLQPTEKP